MPGWAAWSPQTAGGPDQNESGIVAKWRADVAQQILAYALKQVGADAVGAGPGQFGQPGGQRVAPVAQVAGLGHPIGVEQQRVARWKGQRPPGGAAVA
jgi:hypothetical protein